MNAKNHQNLDAIDLAKDMEIKQYLLDEQKNQQLFSFEEMLDLAKNPDMLSERLPVISQNNEYDKSEGNSKIFKKLMRHQKISFYSNSKKKVKSKPDHLIKSMSKYEIQSQSPESKAKTTDTSLTRISSNSRQSRVLKSFLWSKRQSKFAKNLKLPKDPLRMRSPVPILGKKYLDIL